MLYTVTDYLDISALQYPHKICFVDEYRKLTFSELNNEARAIASFLISCGFYKKPILVLFEKSVQCLSLFMGIAYSGNFYTPVDNSMPTTRINKIIESLDPVMIITNSKSKSTADRIIFQRAVAMYEEIVRTSIDDHKIANVRNTIIDTDPLYVLFTSGSTGVPKGVVISHRSVIDYIEWVTDTFGISDEVVFGNQAPFYFDNSVLDIFCTIKNGCTMHIIPEKLFAFPIQLLQYLKDNQINFIFWVPSALCIVANSKALGKVDLSGLKKVLFAGEVMPNKHLNRWRKQLPQVLYANLYGPTEITVDCTYYIVDREFEDNEPLPIGKPCRNTDILVLNERNQLVEKDEIGELCVRGTSLSLGYYNNTEKTKQAFVQNPVNPYYPELIYRTGDYVKYNEFGELIYITRQDYQIKHMGYRIELGEIETAISSMEDVEACCCLYDETNKKIVLFYVSNKEINFAEQAKALIPRYMIPSQIIRLEKMPLNANGKIDRTDLREML